MTQDERWLARYYDVKDFIETNGIRLSSYLKSEGFGTGLDISRSW